MTDFLSSPEGRKAVEAMLDCDGQRLCSDDCTECQAERKLFTDALEAALPHLDAYFRQALAAELEAENKRLDDGESLSTFAAWQMAADFLRRGR